MSPQRTLTLESALGSNIIIQFVPITNNNNHPFAAIHILASVGEYGCNFPLINLFCILRIAFKSRSYFIFTTDWKVQQLVGIAVLFMIINQPYIGRGGDHTVYLARQLNSSGIAP